MQAPEVGMPLRLEAAHGVAECLFWGASVRLRRESCVAASGCCLYWRPAQHPRIMLVCGLCVAVGRGRR